MWRFHADCPSRNWKIFDIDFIHDPIRAFMRLCFFRKLQIMCFWKIRSPMRHLAKPSCGKWPYIDPLVMNFSPEIWLLHCFYNAYFTSSWNRCFPFWAIWALFSKDFVVPAENMYSCITRRAVFLCHKKTRPGAKAGPGPRARPCEYKWILIDVRCSFLACDYWLCCQDTTLCQDRNSGCIRASGQKSLSWSG